MGVTMPVRVKQGIVASLLLASLIPLSGCGSLTNDSSRPTLRIGYQKWGALYLLKWSGKLGKRLAKYNATIEWFEFPSGPPILEALGGGSVDFGHTGDSPPVFAQAAGVAFKYIAATPLSPEGSGIIVHNKSEIQSLKDLKGKAVGFTKGSSAHFHILQALKSVGLTMDDIKPVYLSPPDARAAFEKGSIDAWSIWDPFFAATQDTSDIRVLTTGVGLVSGREFYLATPGILKDQPLLIQELLDEIDLLGKWAKENPEEIVDLLAEQIGMSKKSLLETEKRKGRYGLIPWTDEITDEQQLVADTFFGVGIIPTAIKVSDAVQPIAWKSATAEHSGREIR